MKKTVFVLPFLAILFLSCAIFQEYRLSFNSVQELREFLRYKENRIPLISAHRGGPAPGYPENCIETFQHAMRFSPVLIECDVALSKDSVLVMMHDDNLDRTTTGTGPIGNYTYKELQKFNLEDTEGNTTDFKIPTLDQVLAWGKGKVIFTIDVKRGVPFSKIIEAVHRNKSEAYSVIITYNANQAAEVYQLDSTLMISASIGGREDLERLNNLGIKNENLVAFVGISEPQPAVYEFLHSKGIQCILGTMGNLDKSAAAKGDQLYYDLVGRGADVLSTDRNQQAGSQLLRYMKDQRLKSSHIIINRFGTKNKKM